MVQMLSCLLQSSIACVYKYLTGRCKVMGFAAICCFFINLTLITCAEDLDLEFINYLYIILR